MNFNVGNTFLIKEFVLTSQKNINYVNQKMICIAETQGSEKK